MIPAKFFLLLSIIFCNFAFIFFDDGGKEYSFAFASIAFGFAIYIIEININEDSNEKNR